MMLDNDFPVQLGNGGNSVGFLQQYIRGFNDYQQAGENIPAQHYQTQYGQEQGGPFVSNTLISKSPSFDLIGPDIDSPVVDKWIQQSKIQPGYKPAGPSLPQLEKNIKRLGSTLKSV